MLPRSLRTPRAAAALCLLLLACAAKAQPSTGDPPPLDALQTAYLACDRATTRVVLDAESMRRCADIGAALLARDFDGNFNRLLAWWRLEKERYTIAARPAR